MKRTLAFPLTMALVLAANALGAEDLPLFKLELKDGVIAPQRLDVPAGKRFKLEIRNTGKTAAEFESKPLKKEKVVAPGATALMEIKPLAKGEYAFVDEFHENLPTGRGVLVAK